jgi:hypothetical protein
VDGTLVAGTDYSRYSNDNGVQGFISNQNLAYTTTGKSGAMQSTNGHFGLLVDFYVLYEKALTEQECCQFSRSSPPCRLIKTKIPLAPDDN